MVGTFTDITQRVAASQLRRVLLDQSSAAIFLASSDRRVVYANARGQQIFGRAGESLQGVELRRGHVSDERFDAFGASYETVRENGSVRLEYPMLDAEGRQRWFDISGSLLDREQPDGEVVWTLIDITERKLAEAALAAERSRLMALLEHFPGGVLLEDAGGQIVMANASLCKLLAVPLKPVELVGTSRERMISRFPELHLEWLSGDARARAVGMQTTEVESIGERALEVDCVAIEESGEALGVVWLVRDITGRKQRERRLVSLASTDSLTGLPNRRSFLAALETAIAAPVDPVKRPGVLLMLDIDHFKRVNDTFGHPVGDLVLKHLADVIGKVLRRDDMAGRLGGEEFAILLPGATAESAFGLAERLRRAVCTSPLDTAAGPILVSISIGLGVFDGATADTLLARADEALYEAKEGGRNRVCVWSSA